MYHEECKMNEQTEQVKEGNVLELWAPKYPEVVTQWLPNLQKKAKSAYYFYLFCQWAKKTPTELLALKKDPSSREAEKLLNAFVAVDLETLHMTHPVKFLTVQQVKSFFKWNMCDLAKIAGHMTLEGKTDYHKLTKEGLRKLWNNTYNPRDRALITFICSTAIAKETLSNIKWKHLEENWENVDLPCINVPSELLKGHGRGKYKGVRQTTFLTPEAKRDLINYKEWLEKAMCRKVTPEDNIFRETYAPYKPATYAALGYLMWTLSKRAGVPFSLHDARRWVNTHLEQIGLVSNWNRKIRGRMVRGQESPYSQPAINQLRDKFRETVPLLEFTTETPTINKEMIRDEVMKGIEEQRLKETAEKLHIPLEQVRAAFREKKGDWQRALRALKKETATDGGDCTNGQHCQKIVSEDELPQLLANGWTFVATLSSGKVVVSND
jgi:integrase